MPRVKSFNKRRFYGNQHASPLECETKATEEEGIFTHISDEPVPNTSACSSRVSSVSSKKLDRVSEDFSGNFEFPRAAEGHTIMNVACLCEALLSAFCCKNCLSSSIKLMEISPRKGLACAYAFICEECQYKTKFSNSKLEKGIPEINMRLNYGMRSIGRGEAGAKMFCALMDLPSPPLKFIRLSKTISPAIQKVAEESMMEAAVEAIKENGGNNEITAAFDGTWQKRGHTSLHGVMSVTSADTGKVLDVECLTKFCHKCKEGENKRHHICQTNYEGTSGGMEAVGALRIFERSEKSRGVKYTKYLGDGDSKAFKTVFENNPYNIKVEKLECIGHVQKRMGTRLRKLCADMKGKKMEDGKGMKGKGRLTDKTIDNIQNYYGQAIRRNVDCLENMRKDIWAIFFHKMSTNENPQHGLCPKGEDSWCGFNKALVGGPDYTHKNSLPITILDAMRPIFRDLSHPDLLKKCLHGKTQNPNECFNSVIWERLPKTIFIGGETLKIGVWDAIITFNNGSKRKEEVFKVLEFQNSPNTSIGLYQIDSKRIYKSEQALRETTHMAKTVSRRVKRKLTYKKTEEKDSGEQDYGPGMF